MQYLIVFTLFIVLRHCVNGAPIETAPSMDSYFTPHIIGGAEAPPGYAPHMAGILIGDAFIMVVCGASIIRLDLLLTAAHCIHKYEVPGGLMKTYHGVVGSNNFRSGGTTVQFEDYHIHPEWDSDNIKNDIAVLCLEAKLKIEKNAKPVALNFDWVGGDEPSYVTGWGLVATRPSITPYKLQILEVNTLTPQGCVDAVRDASATWWPQAPAVDPALEICALNSGGRGGMETEFAGLCYGDSGSPLMSRMTGSQIGIASWAFTCALGVPDMYARISHYKEFILHYLGQ